MESWFKIISAETIVTVVVANHEKHAQAGPQSSGQALMLLHITQLHYWGGIFDNKWSKCTRKHVASFVLVSNRCPGFRVTLTLSS